MTADPPHGKSCPLCGKRVVLGASSLARGVRKAHGLAEGAIQGYLAGMVKPCGARDRERDLRESKKRGGPVNEICRESNAGACAGEAGEVGAWPLDDVL